MMRLKQVSSSLCSSLCRLKAANRLFSYPNTPSSSKLRCFSSSDSSDKYFFRRKSIFKNPYIDRTGYPTLVSLEQLEEFMKKYPVLVSAEDLHKSHPSFEHIPHPDLEGMFIEVPASEITYPSICEGMEGQVETSTNNFDEIWYVTSDEEYLENSGWNEGRDFVIPEGWPKDIDYRNLPPKSVGDPPVISEEVDALIYPKMAKFPAFYEFCEERRNQEHKREKNCVPDEEGSPVSFSPKET